MPLLHAIILLVLSVLFIIVVRFWNPPDPNRALRETKEFANIIWSKDGADSERTADFRTRAQSAQI